MPAGPENTMPSASYDYFSPLGEFGQPRRHYHQMRRLHIFLQSFGTLLADTVTAVPDIMPSGYNDTATIRWAVRSNGTFGILFVSNYQRLTPMPAKSNVQFELVSSDKSTLLTLPAEPFTLAADTWFYWPFNLPLGPLPLAYATAQVRV